MHVTETEAVRFTVDGPVAQVELYRPATHNSQTPQMWERLRQIGRDLRGSVRCVVVKGAGPSFSAGLDRSVFAGPLPKELAAASEEEGQRRIAGFQEAFRWLRRPDLLTVAAVQGHAIGAGFQLALACDFRVLAEDAKFKMAETSLGIVPDLGGTGPLVDIVGYSRALELCVTGRTVGAEEAERLGLATLVVDGAELDGAVADLVAALLAAPRGASVEVKSLLQNAPGRGEEARLEAERAAQLRCLRELTEPA